MLLDLFFLRLFTFYHGKSPFDHHLGYFEFSFSKHRTLLRGGAVEGGGPLPVINEVIQQPLNSFVNGCCWGYTTPTCPTL